MSGKYLEMPGSVQGTGRPGRASPDADPSRGRARRRLHSRHGQPGSGGRALPFGAPQLLSRGRDPRGGQVSRIAANVRFRASLRNCGHHPHNAVAARFGGRCADKGVKLPARLNRADYRISRDARAVTRRCIDVILIDRQDTVGPFRQLAAQKIHMIIFVSLDEQITAVEGLNHEVSHAQRIAADKRVVGAIPAEDRRFHGECFFFDEVLIESQLELHSEQRLRSSQQWRLGLDAGGEYGCSEKDQRNRK